MGTERNPTEKVAGGGICGEGHPRRTSVTEEGLRSPQFRTVYKHTAFACVSVCVCVFRRLILPSVDTYKDRSIEDNHSRTRDGFPKNDFLGDTVQIFPGQMLDATFC